MRARLVAGAVAFCVSGVSSARAQPERLGVELSCAEVRAPGRLLCRVVLSLLAKDSAETLAWADALVTRAPGFARPLRARIGFSQSSEHDAEHVVLPLALVAAAPGKGELRVKVRAVVCPKRPDLACTPLSRSVSTELRASPDEPGHAE
jgi:hypothetical protein